MRIDVRESIPSSYQLLENGDFQKWLVGVGILVKGNLAIPENILDGGKKFTPTEEKIWEKLLSNIGCIVPYSKLAPNAFNGYDFELQAHLIAENKSRMRKKMVDRDSIFTAGGFGMGLGVNSFNLPRECGRTLYKLWESLGQTVDILDIAYGLKGGTVFDNIHVVRININRLRCNALLGTSARIDSFPLIDFGYYRLSQIN